jgi:rRNA maturation RNase YbeY
MPGHAVACLITDDRELRELNRRFLRKDFPTDVLSFPASEELAQNGARLTLRASVEPARTTERASYNAGSAEACGVPRRLKGGAGPLRGSGKQAQNGDARRTPCAPNAGGGEMAISLDRAAAQAAAHGHSVEQELRILMLHGLLHLAGMDHEVDAGEMARAEARWRKRLKLPPGLVERAGA